MCTLYYIVDIIQRAIVQVRKTIYDVRLPFIGCSQDMSSPPAGDTAYRQQGRSGRECTENTSPQIITTNMAAVVQGKIKKCSVSTPTLPTGCFHSMKPTHFNLVHLYYLSHACTLVTQLTTDNVLYRTPEGTPIGLVHAHHITSSGIQLVLVDDKPYHISMSSLSCTVHHVGSISVSFVEQ